MDDCRIHVERNIVSTQIHVLIMHLGITIQMGETSGGIVDQGVLCTIVYWSFQSRTLTSGVELSRIC